MQRKKKWLTVAATMMVLCAINAPSARAEEVAPAEITTATEVTEQNTEIPADQPAVEATEAPAEQPATEVVETVETPADPAAVTETPITPTLLADRLAPETYAELEDPNVRIVLIDIPDQYLWAFENGIAVLESPMISGKAGTRSETSRGIFQIEFKKRGKYLRGPKDENGDYAWNCWVDYWMLFDRDRSIGLHDASWRKPEQYTPETYLTNGSRGCVNLPCEFAPLLYDFVEVGTPVIVQD